MSVLKSALLFILLITLNTLYGQDLKVVHISGYTMMNPETYEVMDEVPQEIFQYNYLCKFMAIKDTISIEKIVNGYVTIYKKQPFERKRKNGKYSSHGLTIESNTPNQDYRFKATIKIENNLDYCFEFFKRYSPLKDYKSKHDEGLTVYYESDYKYIGEFKQYTLDRKLYESGHYCQKDTIYRDTTKTMDMSTYETKITITEHKKKTNKCGEWIKHIENQDNNSK